MAVARAEQVICRCDRHSVDQADDLMHQDLGLRRPGKSGAIERAGHGDFGRVKLIETLQRNVQLIDGCLAGSGRRSSQISVVGAGTSCRQCCIHAVRLSDQFVTDSGGSGEARPGSRDPSRLRLGPPGFDPSQRERPPCGWSLLSEGLGRCPRRASSGFHPKRQTPFRVKEECEDGVAFSAPEKPPDACTPAARREGRVAAQCCATTLAEKELMSTDVYERISCQIASELESGARPGSSRGMPRTLPGGSHIPRAGPAGRTSRM
jgi:hypothetical protein